MIKMIDTKHFTLIVCKLPYDNSIIVIVHHTACVVVELLLKLNFNNMF